MEFEVVNELPTTNRQARQAHWQKVADAARKAGGAWVHVGYEYLSAASVINSGRLTAFRPVGAWHAKSQLVSLDKNQADLYVRYLGVKGEDA